MSMEQEKVGLFKQEHVETVAMIFFLIMFNIFTYDVVIHYDEPSYENERNWRKLITKPVFNT